MSISRPDSKRAGRRGPGHKKERVSLFHGQSLRALSGSQKIMVFPPGAEARRI